jgi:hypothetical protein
MNASSNADAGKNVLWPGATPYFGASIAPKSLRASGVAPGHSVFASRSNLQAIPRPHSCQFLSEQTNAAHMRKVYRNRR